MTNASDRPTMPRPADVAFEENGPVEPAQLNDLSLQGIIALVEAHVEPCLQTLDRSRQWWEARLHARCEGGEVLPAPARDRPTRRTMVERNDAATRRIKADKHGGIVPTKALL